MKNYLTLFILFSSVSFANELAIVSGEVSRFYTTDDLSIEKKSLKIMYNRRDLFWNYENAEKKAYDIGAEATLYSGKYIGDAFDSSAGQIILGKKWNSKNYTSFSFGGHNLNFNEKSFSTATYELKHSHVTTNTRSRISLSKDFQFIQQQIPAPLFDGLIRDELALYWEYLFGTNWRFPVNISQTAISDGNSAISTDFAIHYGRSYPTWWWIGYGVGSQNYSETKVGYWSPEKFTSHGPRAEIAYSLADYWQVMAGYNYSFIQEDNFDAGTSTYKSLGFQYGKRDDGLISLTWIEILSEQQSSVWNSKGYSLVFEKSF